MQHRNVICRDVRGFPSGSCNNSDKPTSTQPCRGIGYGNPDCREDEESSRWKKSDIGNPNANDKEDLAGWKKLEEVINPPSDNPMNSYEDTTPVGKAPLSPQRLVDNSEDAQISTEAR